MWQIRPKSHVPQEVPAAQEHFRGLRQPAGLSPAETRVHVDDPAGQKSLSQAIAAHLAFHSPQPTTLTVVCVGSDRSTGDALGPLVGTQLSRSGARGLIVHGTLESPVHAANLTERLADLRHRGEDGLVVAVDACLGKSENVGTVCVKPGPLRPGTGVNKILPPVGAFHIVGVVNVGGFMEYFVLQNTRLNLVMRLADLIARSLIESLATYWQVAGAPIAASKVAASKEM